MRPLVSIIVPTYHRKASLMRLLTSIATHVDRKQAELIIAEQEENNSAAYKSFTNAHGIPFTYIYLTQRSTPHAMNAGVAKSRGKFMLFLDDDVTVTKNFIRHHLNNFTDKRVAATVGRLITDGQPVEPKRRDTGRVNRLGQVSDGFSSRHRQDVDTVIGANTMWRKDIFLRLGGFDERFVGNALRFESDLSLRAKNAGYRVVFEPEALVHHHREPTGGARKTEGFISWYADYFRNETLFFVKNRPILWLPVFWLTKLYWVVTNL